jgi:hypothetical protein
VKIFIGYENFCWSDEHLVAVTDEKGWFRGYGLQGNHREIYLCAQREGYVSLTRKVAPNHPLTAPIELHMPRAGKILVRNLPTHLAPQWNLWLFRMDPPSPGDPYGDEHVEAAATTGGFTTLSHDFDKLPPGRYRIDFWIDSPETTWWEPPATPRPGVSYRRIIDLPEGETVTVDFKADW